MADPEMNKRHAASDQDVGRLLDEFIKIVDSEIPELDRPEARWPVST